MEMTGRVIAILPEKSGTSARGEWHSQSYVIETQEQYPKHLCFDVFGADKIAQFAIQAGEIITVSFDIDARQWKDRWFNQIRGWQVVRPGQQPMQQPQGQQWGDAQAGAAAANAANRATNFPPPPPTGASAAPAGAAPSPDADSLPF